MKVFENSSISSIELPNRIIRSATYEGMADSDGYPRPEYIDLYDRLSRSGIGCIISGCTYVSPEGKMALPGQLGIDSDDKVDALKKVTKTVHQNGSRIVMQISHAGRQTNRRFSEKVYGVSKKRSPYFRQKVEVLTEKKIDEIADQYADAAFRAKQAGFDGVQVHAAHGYLAHQFILPSINTRKDRFGIHPDLGIGTSFLELVFDKIRAKCSEFPVLIKISASDDYPKRFNNEQFVALIRFLDSIDVDAIEISYGSIDYSLNVFRGKSIPEDLVLKYNAKFKTKNKFLRAFYKRVIFKLVQSKFKEFEPKYNLDHAKEAKRHTSIPIIVVGGYVHASDIFDTIENDGIDYVSLCRAFLCEEDFIGKIKANKDYIGKCKSCNKCAIMCDSEFATRCFSNRLLVHPISSTPK